MNPMDTDDWRELTRVQQVLIYTICVLDEAKRTGMITGGHVAPATKAQIAFKDMRASGFKPTREEIDEAINGIQRHYDRTRAAGELTLQ